METKITSQELNILTIKSIFDFFEDNIDSISKVSIYVSRADEYDFKPNSAIFPFFADIIIGNRELALNYSWHPTVLNEETFKLKENCELSKFKTQKNTPHSDFITRTELANYMLKRFPEIKTPDFYNTEGFFTDSTIKEVAKPILAKINAIDLDVELPTHGKNIIKLKI